MHDPDDPFQSPEWLDWADDVRANLLPKLEASAVSVSLYPGCAFEDMDVKFMLETGAAICMGKPVILVVRPGTQVPAGLARAADEIVELDLDTIDVARDQAAGQAILDAIERIAAR